jgi:hypothetical protein
MKTICFGLGQRLQDIPLNIPAWGCSHRRQQSVCLPNRHNSVLEYIEKHRLGGTQVEVFSWGRDRF